MFLLPVVSGVCDGIYGLLHIALFFSTGPMPQTLGDFWRMIWEQDVPIIVMVTNPTERGQVREHYLLNYRRQNSAVN